MPSVTFFQNFGRNSFARGCSCELENDFNDLSSDFKISSGHCGVKKPARLLLLTASVVTLLYMTAVKQRSRDLLTSWYESAW